MSTTIAQTSPEQFAFGAVHVVNRLAVLGTVALYFGARATAPPADASDALRAVAVWRLFAYFLLIRERGWKLFLEAFDPDFIGSFTLPELPGDVVIREAVATAAADAYSEGGAREWVRANAETVGPRAPHLTAEAVASVP